LPWDDLDAGSMDVQSSNRTFFRLGTSRVKLDLAESTVRGGRSSSW